MTNSEIRDKFESNWLNFAKKEAIQAGKDWVIK